MSTLRLIYFVAIALLALPACASAQERPQAASGSSASLQRADQIIYKGLVGNMLDQLPLDPVNRVSLQRTNAVVSNTFFGRSLSALAGLGGPMLMIGGLVWGVWAASNIEPAAADTQSALARYDVEAALMVIPAAFSDNTPDGKSLDDKSDSTTASSAMTTAFAEPVTLRPRVFKVWLP